jgi:hypothetical protein
VDVVPLFSLVVRARDSVPCHRVCSPILQIDNARVHGWHRRGGSDSIRCVFYCALSLLLWRCLRCHGGAGKICSGTVRQLQSMIVDQEAWKVVRGWCIWHDLLSMSTRGGVSGIGEARGKSLVARSSAQKALLAMVLSRFR